MPSSWLEIRDKLTGATRPSPETWTEDSWAETELCDCEIADMAGLPEVPCGTERIEVLLHTEDGKTVTLA